MQLAWLGLAAAAPQVVDFHAHGADWGAQCALHDNQSPIDFVPAHETIEVAGKLVHQYEPIVEPFELHNNGRAIFADLGSHHAGGIVYFETWFRVMNLAFHAPGEHTFDGRRYAGEIHVLHQKWDSPDFLVVAIPIEVPEHASLRGKERPAAPGFNRDFELFLRSALPGPHAKVVVPASNVDRLDLSDFIGTMEFYEYAGSLTVPPCAPAKWMVRKEPMVVSAEQMGDMRQALLEMSAGFGNYRDTQPLQDRAVGLRKGFPTLPMPQATPVASPAVVGSREYRALRNAKDALTASKATGDYIADLDHRIQAAADAHAAALNPEQATGTGTTESELPRTVDLPGLVRQSLGDAMETAQRELPQAIVNENLQAQR